MVRRERSSPTDFNCTGGETQPPYEGKDGTLCYLSPTAIRTQVAKRLNVASGEEGHAMNAPWTLYCVRIQDL